MDKVTAACNRDWRECVDPRCGEGVCVQSGAREFDQSAADKRNKVKVADAAETLESRLREWLDEERRQAAEALDAAASYHGIDIEAEVDMRRSHGRHRMIADRIEKVLHAR